MKFSLREEEGKKLAEEVKYGFFNERLIADSSF